MQEHTLGVTVQLKRGSSNDPTHPSLPCPVLIQLRLQYELPNFIVIEENEQKPLFTLLQLSHRARIANHYLRIDDNTKRRNRDPLQPIGVCQSLFGDALNDQIVVDERIW